MERGAMMLERDITYNNVLDRIERLEMRIEDLRDVSRPAEVVVFEAPNWQALAGWVSTGSVLQDVNGRIVLDPTIPRILIDANGYIESADFVAGTSGFRIDGGTAEFNDIVIRGTIYASVGIIGGWTITATQLKAAGDVILLDSSGVITVGGAGYLQSNPFTSGTRGWRITPTEAEFENIVARGEIRTAVFKYGEVHAQAGQLLVTPNAAKLDADLTVANNGAFNVGEVGRFGVNDIVRLKDGTGDVWLKVTADNGDGTYNYSRQSGSAVGTVFRAGTAVVGYGVAGEGGIVLDAVTANGPFMDIFTHAGSPWTTLTTKVRVGNLAGIVDATLNPTGYGFYSDNVFLKGALVAGGGAVIIDADGICTKGSGAAGIVRQIRFRDTTAGVGSPYLIGRVYGDWGGGPADPATVWVSAKRVAGDPWPVGTQVILIASDTVAGVDVRLELHANATPYGACTGGGFRVEQGLRVGTTGAGADDNDVLVDGSITAGEDMHPDSDGRGLLTRLANRLGISTYTDHFRSGVIPAGYAWQGAPFGGTAPTLNYNQSNDYLRCVPAASTRYLLSKAITNAAASWQNKSLQGRFNGRMNGRFGLRFDDGTDNNYAQIYATGEANNGTMSVSFQYRAGGGAVTTVTSAITMPGTEFICLKLLMAYSAPNYTAYGYLVCEDGSTNYATGFTVAVAWAPAAGRAGLFVENPSVSGSAWQEADWFYNEFT